MKTKQFTIKIRDTYTKEVREYKIEAQTHTKALLKLKEQYIGTVNAEIISLTDKEYLYFALPKTLFEVKEEK